MLPTISPKGHSALIVLIDALSNNEFQKLEPSIFTGFNPVEQELVIGLSKIAESSNVFWTKANNGNTQGFIVGDCIGYLGGWGSAAWDDWWNGNLNPSGQGRRIGQSVIWGAAGSLASGPFLRRVSDNNYFTKLNFQQGNGYE